MIPKIEQLLGVNLNPAESMAQVMAEAGFVDIKQDSKKAAWSPWYPAGTKEHEVGRKFQIYYETGLQGWIVAALVGRGEVCELRLMIEADQDSSLKMRSMPCVRLQGLKFSRTINIGIPMCELTALLRVTC